MLALTEPAFSVLGYDCLLYLVTVHLFKLEP